MQISWNGLGSFSIVSKPAQADVTLVTNPFSTKEQKMKEQTASLVVMSHDEKDANALSLVNPEHPEEGRKVFAIEHAGEFEVQGVFVTGVHAPKKGGARHAVYRIRAEGLNVAFLGALNRSLSSAEIEDLGSVDIAIVPCGGGEVLGVKEAAELITALEPRVVIPSYVSSSDDGGTPPDALAKELGLMPETVAKYKITRAQLPQEEMKYVILT